MVNPVFAEKNPIFLDFETNTAKVFYAAGFCLQDTQPKQVILNENLFGLAKNRNLPILSPPEFAEQIFNLVTERNGYIVAFGPHEKDCLNDLSQMISFSSSWENIEYLNLHKSAKKWINRYHKDDFEKLPPVRKTAKGSTRKNPKWSLISVMRMANFPAPQTYAPGHTTSRFNSVMSGLIAKQQNFEKLTSVQKAKATKVLEHNSFDVAALPQLFRAIKKTNSRHLDAGLSQLFSD